MSSENGSKIRNTLLAGGARESLKKVRDAVDYSVVFLQVFRAIKRIEPKYDAGLRFIIAHKEVVNADAEGEEEPDLQPVAAAQDRLWVIGDSMAFGWGVERHETYTAVIARLSGQPTYSVAGPGNDVCGYQALIDRMPDGIKPRAAIVGLVLENDVRAYDCQAKAAASARTGMSETVSFFNLRRLKQTLTIHSAFYNVLAVSLKRVPMINQLMMSLGLVSREHVVRYALDTAGLGQRIEKTAEAVTKLKAMLPPGIPFAVFLAPARFEIRDNHPFYAEVRHKITAALTARGVAVIDPYLAFRELGFEVVYFPHDGHWAAAGHQVAGATVAAWLESQ